MKLQHLKRAKYSNLQQRCKIDYTRLNDESSMFFFAKLGEKRTTSFIHSITDQRGVCHDGQDEIIATFVSFNHSLIGSNQFG